MLRVVLAAAALLYSEGAVNAGDADVKNRGGNGNPHLNVRQEDPVEQYGGLRS